jgi:pimeloyl-ACP methyl ester carboxylesterase
MAEYLDVAGHKVFSYEWDNNGEALVLLHGGLSQTSHWDSYILPAVEEDFHVFAYDRAGHGFTGQREKSFHYQFQTDEAIAYLDEVVKEPAHLIGYSDGGIVALMVAMQRPELVRSIITLGANFHPSGLTPIADFDGFISEENQEEYNRTSPDAPETLGVKIKKMIEIQKSEPDLTAADLASIQCPVMVMAGDDDVVKHAHTADLFESIPLGQLAIVPGTSHKFIKEKPALAQLLIREFLEDLSYPITRMPVRRTNPRTE